MLLNYSKKLVLILFGLFLSFLFLEVLIRLSLNFFPNEYLTTYGIYQKSFPVIGHKNIPNSSGIWNREGFSKVKINSKGWNDYERTYEKHENTIRVAIVGDSFIEALQVDKSVAIGSIMESWLIDNCSLMPDDHTFEVLSFGASGWGTSQMHLTIMNEIILYEPDYVVLAFFPGNDLKNNIYDLELNPYKPYFELTNEELVLTRLPDIDNDIKKQIYRFFRDNLMIVQFIREPLVKLFASNENMIQNTYSDEKSISDYDKKTELIYGATWGNNLDSIFVSNAWELFESILLKTSKDLNNHDSELLTLIVSRGEIVDFEKDYVLNGPDYSLRENNNISNIFYPEDRLENFGKDNNIPIISISRYMSNYNWSKKIGVTKFHGFGDNLGTGHWNENGHKFAGEIVGQKICEIYN